MSGFSRTPTRFALGFARIESRSGISRRCRARCADVSQEAGNKGDGGNSSGVALITSVPITAWASYRQLIPFVLGTPRARRYWALCAGFFNPAFVRVVEAMIDGQPLTGYWAALAAAD